MTDSTNQEMIVATCQFPVSHDVKQNAEYMIKQMKQAKESEARVCHFSECSLGGYAGIDFKEYHSLDNREQAEYLEKIMQLASELSIWVIIGGHYFENTNPKPFNSLWVINDRGDIVDRYDKRFCTGAPGEEEHFYYTPGKCRVQFDLDGISCGVLICHEWRYPELYREHYSMGTKILFQSWYDGGLSKEAYQSDGQELGSLMTGTIRGMAANNYLWISASNTCRRESCFAAYVVRPDGRVVHQLKRNIPGVLITRIKLDDSFEDPSRPWRDRAMNGILHSDEI